MSIKNWFLVCFGLTPIIRIQFLILLLFLGWEKGLCTSFLQNWLESWWTKNEPILRWDAWNPETSYASSRRSFLFVNCILYWSMVHSPFRCIGNLSSSISSPFDRGCGEGLVLSLAGLRSEVDVPRYVAGRWSGRVLWQPPRQSNKPPPPHWSVYAPPNEINIYTMLRTLRTSKKVGICISKCTANISDFY